MKNQYVCDIGDFGKYLLLNYIAKSSPKDEILSLGINWYLTPDDNKNDGKYTDYLKNDKNNMRDSLCPLSCAVYDKLKRIYDIEGKRRTVESIKKREVLPLKTIFFDNKKEMPTDNKERNGWIKNSIDKLSKNEIIFLDPDNGIAFNEKNKDLTKYVLLSDIKEYIENTNSNIVIYHHGSRRKGGLKKFSKDIIYPTLNHIRPKSQIRILWYHKGTARLYIFMIRQHGSLINNRIDTLLSNQNQKKRLFDEIL